MLIHGIVYFQMAAEKIQNKTGTLDVFQNANSYYLLLIRQPNYN